MTDKAHYFFALERSNLTNPFEVLFDRPTAGVSNVARFGMPISGVDLIAGEQGQFDSQTKLLAILGKVDFQINDSNTFTVRYNFSKFQGVNFGASTVDSDALGMTEDTSDTSNSLVASNTTVIGTNKFNEFRFQYAIEDRPRLGTSNEVPTMSRSGTAASGSSGLSADYVRAHADSVLGQFHVPVREP